MAENWKHLPTSDNIASVSHRDISSHTSLQTTVIGSHESSINLKEKPLKSLEESQIHLHPQISSENSSSDTNLDNPSIFLCKKKEYPSSEPFKLEHDSKAANSKILGSKNFMSTVKSNHVFSSCQIDSYDTKINNSTSSSLDNLLDPGPSSLGSFGSHNLPYFKEFVEDLGPEEYRWFYKAEADKKWIPFIGYDSLRIEWKFRDLLQNGLASTQKIASSDFSGENGLTGTNEVDERPFDLGEDGTITVRGGLYEVNVKIKKGQSIYWKGI
jgi:hypothetical protein